MSLPNPINRGDAITADWLNRLLEEVRRNTLMPSSSILVSRDTRGTTIEAIGKNGINAAPAKIFRVKLEQEGGDAGGAGTLCTFTYTIKTEDGIDTLVESGATPIISMARVIAIAPTTAANWGTVHIDKDGNYVLWDCDEVQTIPYQESDYTPCEAPGS